MTFKYLKDAIAELSDEQLMMNAYILRDREIYVPDSCFLVSEIREPSLVEKLENEYALSETQPLIII